MMAHMMTDEGLIKAANMWLTVAEEKIKLVNNEVTKDLLKRTKVEVSVVDITREYIESTENLCTKLKTTVHEDNFKSSSISCRLVQEGGIPFSLQKIEELSVEPTVYLIHGFLSKKETDDFFTTSRNYKYSPNPGDVPSSIFDQLWETELSELFQKVKNR